MFPQHAIQISKQFIKYWNLSKRLFAVINLRDLLELHNLLLLELPSDKLLFIELLVYDFLIQNLNNKR